MRYIVAVCALLLAIQTPASANLRATVAAEVTQHSNGLFHYKYTVRNMSDSTLCIVEFLLSVAPTAKIQSVVSPDGWVSFPIVDQRIVSAVIWSSEEKTVFNPILPGRRAVFGFDSTSPPSLAHYKLALFVAAKTWVKSLSEAMVKL